MYFTDYYFMDTESNKLTRNKINNKINIMQCCIPKAYTITDV